jgi:hypothetical protein
MAISNTIVETSFTIGTYVFSFLMGGVVLLSSNFKKWFNNRKNITLSENAFLRIHSQLDELLTEMRIKLNCNRTGICRFHNGGYFFDGISIIKSTTTHESCSLGTVSTIENGQSILLTRFIDKMELLQKNSALIHYTSNLKNGNYKAFLESKNVLGFVLYPLFSDKGTKIGHIYCDWNDYDELDELDISYIESMVTYYARIINSLILTENEQQIKHN